ncbi:CAMK family protein kinase [Histomonas meleagridis]|uniref:CAMK family protein kinase n=1 Tax=Histomonas meleagridis TaxID=135588 RepID=UPI003559E335|nr:CAMK family protein kinase [Histomonas meleagridis]KAH0801686.1 CAMK family protein kinase [Histomonas meleagridis]
MPLSKAGSFQPPKDPEHPIPLISIFMAISLIKQISSALNHMHKQGIVHRDIKPQNILIFKGLFQLCDYSVSQKLKREDEKIGGAIGSYPFMAPEIFSGLPYDPKSADIWSFGITVYSLIFGTYPFHINEAIASNEQQNKTLEKFILGFPLLFPKNPHLPKELKIIISEMLEIDPKKRIQAKAIENNEWINEQIDENNSIFENIFKEI